MYCRYVLLGLGAVLMSASFGCGDDVEGRAQKQSLLRFTMKSLDGEMVNLKRYAGKVVMIVNVASKCGYTPQYAQLQALHEKYSDQGLAILGFPCNQFLSQEPGSAEDIRQFCRVNYGVEFDLFSKVDVNGPDACELYRVLTSLESQPKGPGKIGWNFEKFVLDRRGFLVARFGSATKPDDPAVISIIESELPRAPAGRAAASSRAAEHVAFDLNDMRWKKRVLLVFAESREDDGLGSFRTAWDRDESEVLDRDLVLVEVISKDQSRIGKRSLAAASAKRLQRRFQPGSDGTTFILIGKDGSEKLRTAELRLDTLFERIDAMPMRQREMRQSR
jgi:glutathione peroxidase